MTLLTFCAAGFLCSLAIIVAAVTVTALGVLAYTLAYAVWMLVAILVEPRVDVVARAVARDRWSNALRGWW